MHGSTVDDTAATESTWDDRNRACCNGTMTGDGPKDVGVDEIDYGIASLAESRRVPAIVSSTGWTSVGELEMTRRISPVAVCCSRASVSSRLRPSTP